MERIINIAIKYDISNIPKESLTPKKTVKKMVENDLLGYFIEDEGFKSFDVEVKDI